MCNFGHASAVDKAEASHTILGLAPKITVTYPPVTYLQHST